MKANEIRIGIIVNRKHGKGSTETMINENLMSEIFNNSFLSHSLDDFDKILLTGEWLLWFGFVKTYARDCYMKQLGETEHYIYITLNKNGENIFSIGDKYSFVEKIMVFTTPIVQYVHQLRNIYFSLTKEELMNNNLTDYGADSGQTSPGNHLGSMIIAVGSKVKVCGDLVTTITSIEGEKYYFDDDEGEQKYAVLKDLKLVE